MLKVHIKTPEGVEIDKSRLASSVRAALVGEDPEKVWRQNQVPALAQLEEAIYEEGMNDLTAAYDLLATGLELPHDSGAREVIKKSLARIKHPRPNGHGEREE